MARLRDLLNIYLPDLASGKVKLTLDDKHVISSHLILSHVLTKSDRDKLQVLYSWCPLS